MYSLCPRFKPPNHPRQLLIAWNSLFPGTLKKRPILQRLWNTIPKNLYWQLWLAKNGLTFEEHKPSPSQIASKIIGMTVEKLASKGIGYPSSEDFSNKESKWCHLFLHQSSPRSKFISTGTKISISTYPWEIRKNRSELRAWLQE